MLLTHAMTHALLTASAQRCQRRRENRVTESTSVVVDESITKESSRFVGDGFGNGEGRVGPVIVRQRVEPGCDVAGRDRVVRVLIWWERGLQTARSLDLLNLGSFWAEKGVCACGSVLSEDVTGQVAVSRDGARQTAYRRYLIP